MTVIIMETKAKVISVAKALSTQNSKLPPPLIPDYRPVTRMGLPRQRLHLAAPLAVRWDHFTDL